MSRTWSVAGGLALLVAVAGVVAVLKSGGGDSASSERSMDGEGIIDTSFEGWQEPYLAAYARKDRSAETVAGIRFDPNLPKGESSGCLAIDLGADLNADYEAQASLLHMEMDYRPGIHTSIEPGYAAQDQGCERHTYGSGVVGLGGPSASFGEDWFTKENGYWGAGRIILGENAQPAMRADVPNEHWFETTINGQPAAVARPVLDEGLGPGSVYIWDRERDVLTVVHTVDMPLSELLKIAEGIR